MTEAVSHEASQTRSGVRAAVQSLMQWLGSPQLTTVLLVAAIILIFFGTLAQVYQDMWEVIDEYFRAWISWVDVKILFPPSFFPWAVQTDWDSLSIQQFPFPGGALIGLLLVINLSAAHSQRFKTKVRGPRLVVGLVIMVLGVVITWLVIESGHNRQGLQGEPQLAWSTLWMLIRIGLGVCWLASVGAFVYVWRLGWREKKVELGFLAASAVGLALLLAWIVARGEAAALNDSSLRILYKLIQSQIAASVLLFACVLLFKQRAGIGLLHGGVGLLMFGEFFVSHFAVEQQMTLYEGQSVAHTRDIRSVELAISATTPTGGKKVVVVPFVTTGKTSSYATGEMIRNKDLPFELQVVRYFENSVVRPLRQGESNPANSGVARRYVAEAATARQGVRGGDLDIASAYVKFMDKSGGAELGTYLLSQHFSEGVLPQSMTFNGASYGLELRFKQSHKPYQITLLDVRKDDYAGTSMARNYSSLVRLQDPSRNVNLETKIWMNNPLRYAGETFYQSGYNVDSQGKEVSTLQVVRNTGWMIPYVACMIAATGMFAHFFLMLLRFLQQIQGRAAETRTQAENAAADPNRLSNGRKEPVSLAKWLVPTIAVCLGLVWVGSKAMPVNRSDMQLQVEKFGELPVMYEGRVKPIDTLARNSLRILSNRETYLDATGARQPAIRWLLDVIARPSVANQHRVFRIDSLEVLETFGLERRKGFRYSWNELRGGTVEFQKQVMLARQQPGQQQTFYQRKLMDLAQRINRYHTLADAFRPMPLPPFPDATAIAENPKESAQSVAEIGRLVQQVPRVNQVIESRQPPLASPVGPPAQPWLPYASAQNTAYVNQYMKQQGPSPILAKMAAIFDGYEHQNAVSFNQAVNDYKELIDSDPPAGYEASITGLEAYFNHFAPFYNLLPLYAVALLLTVFGWLGSAWPRLSEMMRSSAFWLVVCAFIVHTVALAARVAISGRPPVTNLYSSAVFIGWGCVLIGLFLEYVYRLGIGNLVSSVTGIGALIVAHALAGDGDTIRVLQAVLDTQFWLTAHVLTVTLGYSATFLAGFLGIILIAWYLLGKPLVRMTDRFRQPANQLPVAEDESSAATIPLVEKTLADMIYGTICFATLLSFIGTVLGGLWADDSWGRFWGWDPKENGALIVVLWNALVLHASWARMVQQRGLALLAIGGNIMTAWSWFGVNELGVGLHSYGFTEGAARTLLIFWISQIVVISLALIPTAVGWMKGRQTRAVAT